MTPRVSTSVDEYLRTAYRPDCDFVDGNVLERNAGRKAHSYAQGRAWNWFHQHADGFEPFVEQRIRVAPNRYRVPDVLLMHAPSPDEDVFASAAPYLCLEIMSPDDSMSSLQDRVDDYLALGVPNIWIVDPWKVRAWTATAQCWLTAGNGWLKSADGFLRLPIADLILP